MSPDSKIKQNEKNLGLKFQKITSVIQFEKCLQLSNNNNYKWAQRFVKWLQLLNLFERLREHDICLYCVLTCEATLIYYPT